MATPALTLRALLPLLEAQGRPRLAGEDRRECRRMVAGLGGPGTEQRRSDQPAAAVLGALAETAGQLHPVLRLGLLSQLVCARPEDSHRG